MPTNWFGTEYHPTDEYIDWREKDPRELSLQLRAAYNKIVELGLKEELKVLTDAAYHQAERDEWDANADESI